MRNISFRHVHGENILAFEKINFNFAKLENRSTLILGFNLDDPKSISNGAGKSSILEILTWMLFAKTSREMKYADEIIKLGEDACSGELVFMVGNDFYIVKRGRSKTKGSSLEIFREEDGVLNVLFVDADNKTKQEELEKILGYSFTTFTSAVMFHQDLVAFPDLKPAFRAKLLTEIGGLDEYVEASETAKTMATDIQTDITNRKSQLQAHQTALQTLKSIDFAQKVAEFEQERIDKVIRKKLELRRAKTSQAEKDKLIEDELAKTIGEINDLELEIKSYQEQLDPLPTQISQELLNQKEENVSRRTELLTEKSALEKEVAKLEKQVKDLQKLGKGDCPTCGQPLPISKIESRIQELTDEKAHNLSQIEERNAAYGTTQSLIIGVEQQINEQREQINQREKLIQTIKGKDNILAGRESLRVELWTKLDQSQAFLLETEQRINQELEEIQNEENPFVKLQEENAAAITQEENAISNLETLIRSLENKCKYYDFWVTGFKRVKMMLFDSLVVRLEELSQDFLSTYSSEIFVKITGERETKSGTIKDEIHIEVEKPEGTISYSVYSGGERQKIKLAISLALATLVEEISDRKCNLVFFDEPNEALDAIGKESNYRCFKGLTEMGMGVVVVDHDAYFKENFDDVVAVVKENGTSEIVYDEAEVASLMAVKQVA